MNSNNIYNCRCDIALESISTDLIAIKYNIPYFLAFLIRRKEVAKFEYQLEQYDDTTVLLSLNACIAEEWGEGVAIVEREIARRGLHVEDVERRFDL
jgi:hypothetical protein